jgi:hypothetical protein
VLGLNLPTEQVEVVRRLRESDAIGSLLLFHIVVTSILCSYPFTL